MEEVRVIVAGGRTFNDYSFMCLALDKYLKEYPKDKVVIISGTAGGADKLGEHYALERGYRLERFPADWDKYGKGAGYRRNTEMKDYAKEANVSMAMVFWNGISKGSKHMIDIAFKARLVLKIFNYEDGIDESN